jgi:hypothetical protein
MASVPLETNQGESEKLEVRRKLLRFCCISQGDTGEYIEVSVPLLEVTPRGAGY